MRRRPFLWDEWNRQHIAKHGVSQREAEDVVRTARPPYPRKVGADKQLVWGPTTEGRLLQVAFIVKTAEDVDYEALSAAEVLALAEDEAPFLYIVHARDLTTREKSHYRRFR